MNTNKTINAKRVLSLITALFLCTSLIFLTGCKKKEKSEGSDEKSYYATLNKTIMPADKIKDLPALFKAIKKEAKEHKLSLESYKLTGLKKSTLKKKKIRLKKNLERKWKESYEYSNEKLSDKQKKEILDKMTGEMLLKSTNGYIVLTKRSKSNAKPKKNIAAKLLVGINTFEREEFEKSLEDARAALASVVQSSPEKNVSLVIYSKDIPKSRLKAIIKKNANKAKLINFFHGSKPSVNIETPYRKTLEIYQNISHSKNKHKSAFKITVSDLRQNSKFTSSKYFINPIKKISDISADLGNRNISHSLTDFYGKLSEDRRRETISAVFTIDKTHESDLLSKFRGFKSQLSSLAKVNSSDFDFEVTKVSPPKKVYSKKTYESLTTMLYTSPYGFRMDDDEKKITGAIQIAKIDSSKKTQRLTINIASFNKESLNQLSQNIKACALFSKMKLKEVQATQDKKLNEDSKFLNGIKHTVKGIKGVCPIVQNLDPKELTILGQISKNSEAINFIMPAEENYSKTTTLQKLLKLACES